MNHNDKINRLLQAIDFFSQDLHKEQFIKYGHHYLHDILDLEASCFFVRKDILNKHSDFVCANAINADVCDFKVKSSRKLSKLATLHGRYLTKDFDKYFDESPITDPSVNLVVPVINHSQLLGFIVSSGSYVFEIDSDYMLAINRVINMSFGRLINKLILKNQSQKLKTEVYNLNMLMHLTGQIISETDLESLLDLGIDSIRELTASTCTTIAYKDPVTEKLHLKKTKDIIRNREFSMAFEMNAIEVSNLNRIYSIEKDFVELSRIFKNPEKLMALDAKYIILMIDNGIEGFISISESVNEKEIDQGILYQINTIAFFILIAMKNAYYISEIRSKNTKINRQLKALNQLNMSMENINASETIEELMLVVGETMEIQFGIRNFALLRSVDDCLKIVKHTYGDSLTIDFDRLPKRFYYSYQQEEATTYLNVSIECCNCLVIAPIKNIDITGEKILGYIIITEVEDILRQERLKVIESISHSISPVLKSFTKIEDMSKRMIVDNQKAFEHKVLTAIEDQRKYGFEFYIAYKKLSNNPFEKLQVTMSNVYIFNNYMFTILYDDVDKHLYDEIFKVKELGDLYKYFDH